MSDNLKKLTWENHKKAERAAFMQRLIKKNITPPQYYKYLKNQAIAYIALEHYATLAGWFDFDNEDLYLLKRGAAMLDDIDEMEKTHGFTDAPILSTTTAYVDYIQQIRKDREKLFAHVYVRHMGDLSGGQIIKRLIPGPTRVYEFDTDVDQLKQTVRKRLHDGLVDEANQCFIMVQNFLQELEDSFVGDMGEGSSSIRKD